MIGILAFAVKILGIILIGGGISILFIWLSSLIIQGIAYSVGYNTGNLWTWYKNWNKRNLFTLYRPKGTEGNMHECTECLSNEENPYSTSLCKSHQIELQMLLLEDCKNALKAKNEEEAQNEINRLNKIHH